MAGGAPAAEIESGSVKEAEARYSADVDIKTDAAIETESAPDEETANEPGEPIITGSDPADEAESASPEDAADASGESIITGSDPAAETESASPEDAADEPGEPIITGSDPAAEAESASPKDAADASGEPIITGSDPADEAESASPEDAADEPGEPIITGSNPATEAESASPEDTADEPPKAEFEPEVTPVLTPAPAPQDIAQRRWAQLQSAPCYEWSVRRLLALGVGEQYLKQIPTLEAISEIPQAERPDGLDTLDDRAWEQAIAMCARWEEILLEHRAAWRAEQMLLADIPEYRICQQLRLNEGELHGQRTALRGAVRRWAAEHALALAFLRDDYRFREAESKAFFGRTMAQLVADMLPPPHVMTPWEKLERRLYEQVRDVDMLGDIELDDAEYALLINEFRTRFHDFSHRTSQEHVQDVIMSVALVQIAIRDYRDGSFWPQVAQSLGEQRVTSHLRKLGEVFSRTAAELKLPSFDGMGYVAEILMHTFVCDPCVPRFFDFLYDYYALDANCDASQLNVDELAAAIAGGEYMPRANLLYQHTRHAMLAFPEVGKQRLTEYLSWIDGAFWHSDFDPERNGRIVRAFRQWRKLHPDLNGAYGGETKRHTGKRSFSQPELRLDMHTGQISLHFPRQRLPLQLTGDVAWHVEGTFLAPQQCLLTEGATCLYTQEMSIPFPEHFLHDRITTSLMAQETVLRTFTIQEDCVRAFDDQGVQINGRRLKAGVNICFVHPDAPLRFDRETVEQQVGMWLMQRCELADGDVVFYPDGSVSIVGNDLSEGLCGVAMADQAYVTDQEGMRYDLYPHMPRLFLRTTQEHFDNGRLLINGEYIRLRDLPCTASDLHDRSAEQGFLVTLPHYSPDSASLYHIRCDIPAERDQRTWHFAYLRGFAHRFENDGHPLPYWGVPRGSVTVSYAEPLQGEGLIRHPRKNEFGFDLHPDVREICLTPKTGAFALHLEIPHTAWKMDEGEWRTGPIEEIWLSDLGRSFTFRTRETELTIQVDTDGRERGRTVTFHKALTAEYIVCDLTAIRTWLTRDRIMHELYVWLGQRRVLLARVYCASFLNDARLEADYQAGGIRGVFDIIGRGRYVVSLVCKENILAEQVPIIDGQAFLPLPMYVGEYVATIYEAVSDDFGFGDQLYELGTAQCQLIDPENLCGRRFHLGSLLTLDRTPVRCELARKRYWIDLTERDCENKHRYYGVMRIDTSLGEGMRMPVIVTMPDRNNLSCCQLSFMEDGEEMTFLYDFATQRLVQREAEHLHYMERYRRYSLLDPEDLLQVIYL